MIIFSDINLEPFLEFENNEKLNFIYREDYQLPSQLTDKNILFIFSDFFRVYSKENIEKLTELINSASQHNKVYVLVDLLFDKYVYSSTFLSLNSKITSDDYNLELGYYSQYPFKKSGSIKLQNLISSLIHKAKNPLIKSIFVDLDNTLIPGVWEEDNDFIRKNYSNHRMWKYKRLFKILIKCHSHGSQIIVVSKNDKISITDALNFISPYWKNYITYIDYGWNSKGQRISNIIKKMNIGSQDCLFIDDNEVEIKSVRNFVPEINLIHFDNHLKLEEIERLCYQGIAFNKSSDKNRNQFYSKILGNSTEKNIEISKTNYSFEVLKNDSNSYDRIMELSVKTNQMNFNKSEIISINDNKYDYYSINCVTEFSSLGNVGYYVFDKQKMIIENFVMSCRALGFGLEDDFLNSALSLTNKIKFQKSKKNNVAHILINKYLNNGKIIIQNS